MHDIRTLIGKLNFMGSQHALGRETRKLALRTGALFRKPTQEIRSTIEGISRVAHFAEAEAESWLDPEDITAGKSGGFDACDLRHWLILAEKAGVPAVPAREILSLSEDEICAIDQKVKIPGFVSRTIKQGMIRAFSGDERAEMDAAGAEIQAREAKIDPRRISEALFDAMDEVPHDWIVRSNLAGPSTLKAFAGAGVLEDGKTSWSPGDPELEIGPGWVRNGNRRRIDATDKRLTETFACGHKDRLHYLARPWVKAARRAEGPDPHRHGTPFAGKGSWPCEWRVFVENGRVTGVASYYGWIGEATPLNAARALEAAELAQKMIDTAAALGLSARFMDLELARMKFEEAKQSGAAIHADYREIFERFPRDGLHCTLDFIEAEGENGPVLTFLEGGPPHSPLGGGHPCAFAGHELYPGRGAECKCEGVALKLMDHVTLADPRTWTHGETKDRILSWEDARVLAANA